MGVDYYRLTDKTKSVQIAGKKFRVGVTERMGKFTELSGAKLREAMDEERETYPKAAIAGDRLVGWTDGMAVTQDWDWSTLPVLGVVKGGVLIDERTLEPLTPETAVAKGVLTADGEIPTFSKAKITEVVAVGEGGWTDRNESSLGPVKHVTHTIKAKLSNGSEHEFYAFNGGLTEEGVGRVGELVGLDTDKASEKIKDFLARPREREEAACVRAGTPDISELGMSVSDPVLEFVTSGGSEVSGRLMDGGIF